VSGLLWLGSLAILATQLIGIARILEPMLGVPKYAGCLIGGVVITIYFTAGGLLTSAWVNVVQLAVKMAGFAIAMPLALSGIGGWSALAASPVDARFWNPWRSGSSGWMYLAMLGPAFVISPGLLQKIYTQCGSGSV
jgi:SSS family solute:Na+ symporter